MPYRCAICEDTFESIKALYHHWRYSPDCRTRMNAHVMSCGFPPIAHAGAMFDPPVITRAVAVLISVMIHLPIALWLLTKLEG